MSIRSWAMFKDGHEEDIFYYKDLPHNHILFGTKSGVYIYRPSIVSPAITGLKAQEFYTIKMSFHADPTIFPDISFVEDPYIQRIFIDRRIERKFTVSGHGNGSVFINPEADSEDLAWAILNEMGVKIEDIS